MHSTTSTSSPLKNLLLAALAPASLLLLLGASGCAVSAPEPEDGSTSEGDPEGVGAAAEALDSCNYYNYYHDEAANPLGSNRCSSDCDCDGMRTCSPFGWCQGEARPFVGCTSTSFYWNEAWTPYGANQCSNDCDCDGARRCSPWGWCQGTAR